MTERTKGPWTRACFQVYGADKSRIAHTGMGQLPPYRSSESEANAAAIVKWENSYDDLVKALENVRAIISEGAMTGFNYKDGDWAERLFASQQMTSAALAKVKT